MKTVNVIKLSGNLTKSLEARTPKGSAGLLTEFLGSTIAHNTSYKDSNGQWQKARPAFYSIIVSAENIKSQFLKNDIRQGDHVVLEGRLVQKENGSIYVVITKLVEFDRCRKNSQVFGVKKSVHTDKAYPQNQKAYAKETPRQSA
jgi:single-stranded DNA-binding protein